MQKECHINSPVFFKSTKKDLIPPFIHKDKIYVISDKKLYSLVCSLGKLSCFVRTVRIKGYKYTFKWLKQNRLFNEHILEEISHYHLDNKNFKSLKSYIAFDKQNNLIANIDCNYFRNYFEKVILYSYIKNYKQEFNIHVKNRLYLVENELKSIKNTPYFKNRISYHQKQIFEGILNSFLNEMYFDPNKEFEIINDIDFKINSNFLSNNLGVYRISGLNKYTNCSLKKTNIRYKECLKPNNSFSLKFINPSQNTSKINSIIKKSQEFTQDKLNFEKDYIFDLINKNKKDIVIEKKALSLKVINTIEQSYFRSMFKKIKNSNMIIVPIDKVLKTILLLNMETNNANKLNTILEKSKSVYSEIVELAQESNNDNLEAYGYASIN